MQLAGLRELEPHHHGEGAGDEQQDEAGHQVLQADDLVVGREPEVARPVAQRAVGRDLVFGVGRLAGEPSAPEAERAEPDQPADLEADVAEGEVVTRLGLARRAAPRARAATRRQGRR